MADAGHSHDGSNIGSFDQGLFLLQSSAACKPTMAMPVEGAEAATYSGGGGGICWGWGSACSDDGWPCCFS